MSSKLKSCKACSKEVAKSAKTCPHCGKKLKMGWFLKFIIFIFLLGILGELLQPSAEEKAKKLNKSLNILENSQPSELESSGKLGEMFNFGSKNTNVQREEAETYIKNKIVKWSLRVYEVSKYEDYYKVQTYSEVMENPKVVSAFIYLYPRNDIELSKIKSLKTNDIIHFKGKITGTSMRSIIIDPAIIY